MVSDSSRNEVLLCGSAGLGSLTLDANFALAGSESGARNGADKESC